MISQEQFEKFVVEKLRDGAPKREIVNELIANGVNKDVASRYVESVQASLRRRANKVNISNSLRPNGDEQSIDVSSRPDIYEENKDLVIGYFIMFVGLAVTLVTWSSAKIGGSYLIMYGAIAVGLYKISQGLEDKISNSPNSTRRKKWILVAIATGLLAVGIAIFITIVTM